MRDLGGLVAHGSLDCFTFTGLRGTKSCASSERHFERTLNAKLALRYASSRPQSTSAISFLIA